MSDDPLRRWSKEFIDDEAPDPTVYSAYLVARGSAPPLIDIRRADGSGKLVPYRFVMDIPYTTLNDGRMLISLLSPSQTVTLEGRNLNELLLRLQNCEIVHLQEFDPKRWPLPEVAAPIISLITINAAN